MKDRERERDADADKFLLDKIEEKLSKLSTGQSKLCSIVVDIYYYMLHCNRNLLPMPHHHHNNVSNKLIYKALTDRCGHLHRMCSS